MELGLSQADEVSHLYHMVSEGDWRLCVRAGPYDSEHSDARSSKAVTLTLRHGRAHASFAMGAVGYVALAQVYEALLQPDAAFHRERDKGHFGDSGGFVRWEGNRWLALLYLKLRIIVRAPIGRGLYSGLSPSSRQRAIFSISPL